MPVTSPNTERIIYATQAVGLGTGVPVPGTGAGAVPTVGTSFEWLHGVQSVAVSTTFNTEQLFEVGQLQIFQNVDEVPDIELSLEKVIDGNKSLYLSAVGLKGTGNVLEAAKGKCDALILVYPDTFTAAKGTGTNGIMYLPTLRVSNVSYTFSTDGNFTESLTLAGNDKVWYSVPSANFSNSFGKIDEAADAPALGVVAKRNTIKFNGSNTTHTILPSTIYNVIRAGTGNLQSITISADFGREDNLELGSFRPYTKFVTVPLQTTCDFEVLSLSGDWVSASGNAPRPASKESIAVVVDIAGSGTASGYLKVDLGSGCRLTSVNYGGGDAGGGNVTNTYNYVSFNYFQVSDSYSAANAYWS